MQKTKNDRLTRQSRTRGHKQTERTKIFFYVYVKERQNDWKDLSHLLYSV